MESIKPFVYLPEIGLIICDECHKTVIPNRIAPHLRSTHKTESEEIKRIVAQVNQLDGLIRDRREVVERAVRRARCKASIPQLPTYKDGLMCDADGCDYVVRTVRRIEGHCRNNHDWKNPQTKGGSIAYRRASHQVTGPWRTGIHCQRFFTEGVGQEYFQVRVDNIVSEVRQGEDGENVARQLLSQIIDQRRKAEEKERKKKKIKPMEKLEASPWLNRVKWPEHLAGHDMDDLMEHARLPDKEGEEVLALMCESFSRMIDKAVDTVETSVSTRVRFEMNRKDRGQEPSEPFTARMEKDTKARYKQVYQRLLGYVYRTRDMDRDERPQYEFTERQRSALEEFVQAAEAEEQRGQRAPAITPVVGGDEAEEEDEEVEDELEADEDRFDGVYDEEGEMGQVAAQEQEGIEREKGEEEEEGQEDEQEEDNVSIDRTCLKFFIAMLDHVVEDNDYSNALASGLAVLGIKEDGTWQGAMDYTSKLSAVVKLARIMVVQKAYQTAADKDGRCWYRVRKMVRRFMVRSKPTPMSWIYDVRTYGLKIRFTTTAQGNIWWVGETLYYQNIHFTMSQYRGWVHGLVEECRRFLVEDLMMMKGEEQKQLPTIRWDTLRDNPAELRDGWYFVHDERNTFDIDGGTWLFERVMSDEKKRRQFYTPLAGQQGWRIKKDGVEAYLRKLGQWLEKLGVGVHLASGQPARVPELFSIRYCNTVNGGQRNVFIEDGLVKFVASYHKGYNHSGNIKIIHRYLPRELGETFVYYAWLVIPFVRDLSFAARGWEKKPGFIWDKDLDGRKWTSARFRRAIKRESTIGMGVAVNIASYRQCAAAISDKWIDEDRLADTKVRFDEYEDGNEKDWKKIKMPIDIIAEQNSNTAHIRGVVYGRGIEEGPFDVRTAIRNFRDASIRHHQFQQFASALRPMKKRKFDEDEAMDLPFRRWKKAKNVDQKVLLRRVVGKPDVEFRGAQEEAMEAIMGGESPMLVVMGTGGGKSMLFTLPALCSAVAGHPGTTIVVVPMISLRQDQKRRFDELKAGFAELKVSCVEWNARRQEIATVVLITPESFVTKGFGDFLNRLRAMQVLERIVVDECHVLLDSKGSFRPKLMDLGEAVVQAETQVIMLTATLPPSDEGRLFKIMGFEREVVRVFRAATTRKNVRYMVEKCEGKSIQEVVDVVQALRLKMGDDGSIVVYTNTTKRAEDLAEALGCDYYHGKEHDEVKARNLQDWINNRSQIIAATNALGLGIDKPNIRAVVHAERPDSLRDYGQESGRGGRDGKMSEAIIMDSGEGGARKTGVDDIAGEGARSAMRRFMSGNECRRVVLDEYLDGRKGRVRCEAGEEACDICAAVEAGEEEIIGEENVGEGGVGEEMASRLPGEEERERIQFEEQRRKRQELGRRNRRRVSDDAIEVEDFERKLDEWSGRCVWCYFHRKSSTGHILEDCSRPGAKELWKRSRGTRGRIRMADFAGCRRCGVPQGICYRWRQKESDIGWFEEVPGAECQYRDGLMIEVIVVVLVEEKRIREMVSGLMREDLVGLEDVERAMDWFKGVSMERSNEVELGRALAWFGQRVKWGGFEASMVCKVFQRFGERRSDRGTGEEGGGLESRGDIEERFEERIEERIEDQGEMIGGERVEGREGGPIERVTTKRIADRSLEQEEVFDMEKVERRLEEWSIGCVLCRAMGETNEDHRISECVRIEADKLRFYIEKMRRSIRWEKYSGCYGCGCPQGICKRWERNPTNGLWKKRRGGWCQFEGVLISSVLAIWYRNSELFEEYIHRRLVKEGWNYLAGDFEEFWEAFTRWIGKKVEVDGFEINRMCEVFIQISYL